MSEQKIKILHYIYQDDFGGGPKALWSISRQFSELATQHIACKGSGKLNELAIQDLLTEMHHVPDFPGGLFILDSICLAGIIWRLRPDVVFVHGQRGGAVSDIASFFIPKTRLVYVAHFIGLYEATNLLALVRNYLAEKITYRRHPWIVCLSEGNIRLLTFFGLITDRYRVRLIPNAVDSNQAVTETIDPSVPWNPSGKTRFLFMGRLAFQKRVDWLLHAWAHALAEGLQDSELIILGSGPLGEELKRLSISLGISESVRFAGHVKNPENILASCDVVVFPSLFENHANVPLEALAAGKPIITMDADGVRETFTDGIEGFIAPIGDWKMFGEKILLLARNPALRAEMGRKGRDRAQYYHPDINGDAYRKLLREILHASQV